MIPRSDPGQPVPPWRLRDLDRRGRLVALAVGALLLAPFLWSAGRALALGWVPASDDALVALRTHDVFSRHFPLIGQPSTSGVYSDAFTYHPGPMGFWVLAPLQALFGAAAGQLFGAALVNGLAVVTSAWVVFRRAGPRVALGGAVVLGLVVWSQGTAVMSDPVSSNFGGYASLATGFLAWALVRGDVRLAPLTAWWAAFSSQQHLAYTGAIAMLAALAGVLVAITLVRRWRRAPESSEVERRGPARGQLHARPPVRHDLAWLLAGVAFGLLLWAPPLVQQVTGDPGNIGEVVRYARTGDRESLGLEQGVNQVLRPLGDLTFLFTGDHDGNDILATMPAWQRATAYGVLALLVVMVVTDRRRRPERAALAAVTLILAVVRVVNGANLPMGLEPARINLYRSVFGLAAMAWLAVGWWVGEHLAGLLARRVPPGRLVALRPLAVGAVLVVLVAGNVGSFASRSEDDGWRNEPVFDVVPELMEPLRAALPDGATVMVVTDGQLAGMSVAPAVALALEEAGHPVRVRPIDDAYYGGWRAAGPSEVDAVLVVRTAQGVLAPSAQEGEVVAQARLNPELNEIIDGLAEELRGQRVELRPDAVDIMERAGMKVRHWFSAALALERMSEDPAPALRQSNVIEALGLGVLVEPRIAPETIDRMVELLEDGDPSAWGDDRIELLLVAPEDFQVEPNP